MAYRKDGYRDQRDIVLSVRNLRTRFYTPSGVVKAVDNVSFDLNKGECLCLVGESGCGKTATALSILRLIDSPPGRIEGGEVLFRGQNLLNLSHRELRQIRGKEIAMVFQDAQTSLNPVLSVGEQLIEPMLYHLDLDTRSARNKAIDIMERLGIPSARKRFGDYPHQFSGGMQQRILIAMALSCDPEILIADEPTTAVDTTIKAQILDIFHELKETHLMSLLFITHDLGVVAEIADRVLIMYAGRIVESGTVWDIFDRPAHPYTSGLLNCLPDLTSHRDRLTPIPGNIPDLTEDSDTCAFEPRCQRAIPLCRQAPAPTVELHPEHKVTCHLYG